MHIRSVPCYFILAPCSQVNREKPAKPTNSILVLVDDLAWQDTSVPFWKAKTEWNERYQMPAMEGTAADGILFN